MGGAFLWPTDGFVWELLHPTTRLSWPRPSELEALLLLLAG
jgi:hypothetical protein